MIRKINNSYNYLLKFVERISQLDEPITKEDLYDELCFFTTKEIAYETVYGEEP